MGQPQRAGLVLGYAGATEAELLRAGQWLADAWLETTRHSRENPSSE